MKVSKCFSEKLWHFTFQPVMYKLSNFFTYLLAFGIVTIFYFLHFDKYVLTEVIICISLISSDVQYTFICLLDT